MHAKSDGCRRIPTTGARGSAGLRPWARRELDQRPAPSVATVTRKNMIPTTSPSRRNMDSRRRPPVLCLVALLALLPSAPLTSTTDVAPNLSLRPSGKASPPVLFDAVLEIETPEHGCEITLFATYRVTANSIQAGVLWAEPHGRGLDFPVYPLTLRLQSDPTGFTVAHDLVAGISGDFPPPGHSSTEFTNMFGDFPISNVRFLIDRAQSARVSERHLARLFGSRPEREPRTLCVTVPDSSTDSLWNACHGIATVVGDRLLSMTLFNQSGDLLKNLEYDFDDTPGGSVLRRLRAYLPERKVEVTFPGRGIALRSTNGVTYLRHMLVQDRLCGRTCEVEYSNSQLPSAPLCLPVSLSVAESKSGHRLRRAKFYNYRTSDPVSQASEGNPMLAAGFDQDEAQYRHLLVKYWKEPPSSITSEDAHEILRLIGVFDIRMSRQSITLGERLKYLNILLELTRSLGMGDQELRHYLTLLETLRSEGLNDTLLETGYCAIDTLVLWRRLTEADAFLIEWKRISMAACDLETILRFADRELKRGNCWAISRILENGDDARNNPPALQFRLHSTEFRLLRKAHALVKQGSELAGEIAAAQAHWISAATGPDQIASEMRAEGGRAFALVPHLENLSKQDLEAVEEIRSVFPDLTLPPSR